jgi:hypothetical protein
MCVHSCLIDTFLVLKVKSLIKGYKAIFDKIITSILRSVAMSLSPKLLKEIYRNLDLLF